MKISLSQTKTFKCSDPLVQDQADDIVIWWYGPLVKNTEAPTIPKIIIFVRKIDANGKMGPIFQREAALTHLGLLRIGTIWRNGQSRRRIQYEAQEFDVSYSVGEWKTITPYKTVVNFTKPNPIPIDEYELKYLNDRNYLLDFKLFDGRNLLIPCTEYFVRCYGRSPEVKRVLASYPWEVAQIKLFMPTEGAMEPGTWPVRLAEKLHDEDALFVAHVLYDRHTTNAAKAIYAQIESSGVSTSENRYLKIIPWHTGHAKLEVEGIRVNGGKTFLGLRINGCSEPAGTKIFRDRENSNKTDGTTRAASNEEELSNALGSSKQKAEIAELVDDREPDHGAASLELQEDDFKVLGERREVVDVRRTKQRGNTPEKGWSVKEKSAYSTGEAYGSGKGVGYASIKAHAVMESHGVMRDMWDALRHLQKRHPDVLRSVEWFTFENGFSDAPEPKLVALEAFTVRERGISKAVREWVYIDVNSRIPRGVLVMRIETRSRYVYLIEIQRRKKEKKALNDKAENAEDNFRGLVFEPNDKTAFSEQLHELLDQVRRVKGIVKLLVNKHPGVASVFVHKSAESDNVPQKATVRRVLRDAGVDVPT